MSDATRGGRGFVLVHGGGLGSWCWRDVRPLLNLPSVAVDLPGRTANPVSVPLRDVTLSDWIESVAEDVVASGFDEVVLVGHSIAGLLLPSVSSMANAVRALVFVGAVVAPPGEAMLDQHPPRLAAAMRKSLEREMRRVDGSFTFVSEVAVDLYGSDRALAVGGALAPEPPGIPLEPAPQVVLRPELKVTYVRLTSDHAVPAALAESSCAALLRMGCAELRIVEIDATHDVMLSAPASVAGELNEAANGGIG